MFLRHTYISAFVLMCSICVHAQEDTAVHLCSNGGTAIPAALVYKSLPCKSVLVLFIPEVQCEQAGAVRTVPVQGTASVPLLQVHGNVLYNFSYRSYIDTPFAQQDVMQHLVQTNLNVLVKGRYPLRITISSRSSNSPWFKNATDVNVQFSQRQLLDNIKTGLYKKANSLVSRGSLQTTEELYNRQLTEVQQLQQWVSSPARVQELVEEREQQLQAVAATVKPDLPDAGTGLAGGAATAGVMSSDVPAVIQHKFWNKIKTKAGAGTTAAAEKVKGRVLNAVGAHKPGIDSSRAQKLQAKKEELAGKMAALKETAAKLKQAKKNVQDSLLQVKKEISSLGSGPGLKAFMKRHGISKDSLTKAQRLLLAINKIGIGRSWIDCSELTVKNISLTGVNIELNPAPFYFAVAAGRLNYRFRDFIVKDNKALPAQSLYLVRAGVGQKERSNIIFTFYNGRKEVLSAAPTGTPAVLQRVLGVSAEARLALSEHHSITAEFARSSYGGITNPRPGQGALLGKVFDMKTRSNEAWSLRLNSQYPAAGTRITAYYRKTGENFQSFNLMPAGNNQEAWMAGITQVLWKRKLTIDAAVRKNDFENPVAAPSFSSTNVFKSLQLTLRVPRYPFVSIGYYPASQLSLSSGNVLTESRYNTLNVVSGYSYAVRRTAMNTNAVFTKFYNSSSDSGFIYYNAVSFTANHSMQFSKLTLLNSMAITRQAAVHLFTLEQGLQYQCRQWLNLQGSIRHSRLNRSSSLVSGMAGIQLQLKKIGMIQLNYDKIYLPGNNRELLPVDMGRAGFYREF